MKLLRLLFLSFSVGLFIGCQNIKFSDSNIIGLWTDEATNKGFGKTFRFYEDKTVMIKCSQLVNALPGDVAVQKGKWQLSNDKIICKITEQNIVVVKGGKPIVFEDGSWSDDVQEIKKTDLIMEYILNKTKEEGGWFFMIDGVKFTKISVDPNEP